MSDEDIRRHVDEAEVVDIPTGGRLKAVSIEAFLRMELPPREMLLGLWLPGQGLVMVFAPRGVGKTYVALGIAYAVSSGGQFLKWEAPKARRVLYIDGEMPGVVMQERLAGWHRRGVGQGSAGRLLPAHHAGPSGVWNPRSGDTRGPGGNRTATRRRRTRRARQPLDPLPVGRRERGRELGSGAGMGSQPAAPGRLGDVRPPCRQERPATRYISA